MSKLAFVFPGQGAQKVGMGKDFYDNYDVAKKMFKEADEALGYSIMKMCFEGPEEDLKLTANTQPAILTISCIANEILKENGIQPEITGGHSLGEYSALVAAGVLNFQDAVALVHKRGSYMQEAVPVGEGGMAAIIGVDRDKIVEVCQQVSAESPVQAVNFNCPGQIVIAGATKGVELAVEELKAAGAKRVVQLNVSGALHSPLLLPAGRELETALEGTALKPLQIPYVTNVTAETVTDIRKTKELLVRQISSPVLWMQSVETMIAGGTDTFVEIGPGRTLAGFLRKIAPDRRVINVAQWDDVEKAVEALC